MAYTLIMTNLEKGGGKACEGGKEGVCWDLIGSCSAWDRNSKAVKQLLYYIVVTQ